MTVYGGEIIIHRGADGQITTVNGAYVPDITVSTAPSVAPEVAVRAAAESAGIAEARASGVPELAIYPYGPQARLAWQVYLVSPSSPESWLYFVDANTSEVLAAYPKMISARNRTTYSANHTETIRGTLVITESASSSTDAIAWATHVNMGTTYDYFKNKFGRDSFDNHGAEIIMNVHYGAYGSGWDTNAFWSGNANDGFGFGDGDRNNTLFAAFGRGLDVVAHEFTHAVTQYTANLAYNRESGALNESYSDVFGEFVDSGDWIHGAEIYTPGIPGDGGTRSLADPPQGHPAQPDHMSNFQSYPWYTICDNSNDNCGVHHNSGIPNKAGYLLAEGGTFHDVTVQRIGRTKAEQIYYRTLTNYLTGGSNFTNARDLSIRACQDLYGTNSVECRSVQDAFSAVGIGTDARFYTQLSIDGRATQTFYTQQLLPGAAALGSTTVTLNKGSHTVKVVVDSTNLVQESNESNNELSKTWTWQ